MVAILTDRVATIAASGTTTGEINVPDDYTLVGFFTPATFTGTSVTMTAAPDKGGTFVAVQDGAGNAITLTVSTSKFIGLDAIAHRTIGLKNLKLVSGSSESSARDLRLVFAKI